ncbi:tetratricopeptide repeat protein [Desulfovibrio sp. OttesenSCG-928-F20]|nr:tetratricopeptide repeat protein [Desulfovibrio sp. OttesenSCG-928-F20]
MRQPLTELTLTTRACSGAKGCILIFCLALFCAVWPGQVKSADFETTQNQGLTAAQVASLVDPSGLHLSPEAEHLYYYLVLSQALADNSQLVIAQALRGLLKLDPSLEVFQDSATILLSRREFVAAETLAKDGLRHFPGDSLLTLLLSGAYSENGRIPEAIKLLEAHLKKTPDHVESIEELVKLYLKAGQEQKASDLLTRLPQSQDQPESELFRAGVLASVGRLQEAGIVLRQLLQKNPAYFEAWLELAYVAEEEDKIDDAIDAYLHAAALMPDNPDLWFRVSMLHLSQKRPEKALEALEKAAPNASMLMQAAVRFADGKHYSQAEDLVRRAAEAGGSPDESALLLSMILQESSDSAEPALAPLADINSDSPLYPAAQEQKARIHLTFKDYASAYAVASAARKAFPDRKPLWGLEAYTLLKQNKIAESEQLLESALKSHPVDEELLFSLGSVQHEAGKDDEALKTMELIITVNPENYQALNYVGYSLAETGKELNRAYTLVAAALEQRPDADYIVDSMAWVQYKMGRHEEAWKSINRCIALGGDDAAIWEHYADIALALGKKEEAVKGYKEAIAREPDNMRILIKKLADLEQGQ